MTDLYRYQFCFLCFKISVFTRDNFISNFSQILVNLVINRQKSIQIQNDLTTTFEHI